jgi:uncharacterized protein HemY
LLPRLERLIPGTPELLELRAEFLMADGKPEAASQLLKDQCQRFQNGRRCKKLLLTAAARTRSAASMAEATRAIIATGCETPTSCAESFESLGDTMAGTGNWEQARLHFERASKEEPSPERWLKLANAASRTGAHLQAADAYGRVLRERGPDAGVQAKMDAERRRGLLRQVSVP